MSPIIDLQRRLVEVGRIRMGKKGDKGQPQKLDTWRLTSRDETRLSEVNRLYNGTGVFPWEGREGEFECITGVDELPILILPGQTLSQWHELWSGGGCQRRCDGQREILSDSPCLCDGESGERKCKPTTRLSVMLPDVLGLGCWRLESHGYYAAVELSATAAMLEQATARGQLLPARLRIDQRRQVKDGRTTRYAVPVIDIDITMREALPLTQAQPVDAISHTPVRRQLTSGVTIDQGLEGAASSGERRSTNGRSAAPIPDVDEVEFGAPLTVEGEQVAMATAAQKKKLNVQVGKLRDAGQVTTAELYELTGRFPSQSEALHWAPLRDELTKQEASALIEHLESFEPGLSYDALKAWINQQEADTTRLAELAKELFPGRSSFKSLTDRERAQVKQRYEELVNV